MILAEATDADFAALVAGGAPRDLILPDGGIESAEVLEMLRGLAAGIRPVFQPSAWLIVEGREVVGLCSLVKAPGDDGIDIGYGIAPARRQRGLAVSAVRALVDWARGDNRVNWLRAETSIENLPSQRVLEANQFVRRGGRVDQEDGELICWSLATG